MPAYPRLSPAVSAVLVLAAGLALFFTWDLLGAILAEILLAAVVGGALVVGYRLRRYARERLVYSPAARRRAPAPGVDARTTRTGV